MPGSTHDKLRLTCPYCGHQQLEPRSVFSTNCRKCGRHIRAEEVLNPPPTARGPGPEQRQITCFDCGAVLNVPLSAESTMCKRCSAYVDLKDYRITSAVSKNFKTKGNFVVEQKGYVFNTEVVVADAVIKGRFLGKIFAERSLMIYSSAEIKGSFTTGKLIIPEGNHFRWNTLITAGAAEIGGEIVGNLKIQGTALLKATARMFGDIEAENLTVEEGAVVVGNFRVGTKSSE
jgi:cytoskeletal protein CcmA (bactofilin family)